MKQLQTFCGMLLENNEEDVVEALMTDQFADQGVLFWHNQHDRLAKEDMQPCFATTLLWQSALRPNAGIAALAGMNLTCKCHR